jgi:hypothetical protein
MIADRVQRTIDDPASFGVEGRKLLIVDLDGEIFRIESI